MGYKQQWNIFLSNVMDVGLHLIYYLKILYKVLYVPYKTLSNHQDFPPCPL